MNSETGKWMMFFGSAIVLLGLIIYFFHDKLNWFGRLPGDIRVENDNYKFYFPVTTMIVISLIVSFIIYLIRKFQ
jgi:flagellar biogenesis protein FliO